MNNKVAIHHYEGDFSNRWIMYCKEHNIEYDLVDCYQNNIIKVLKEYDVLLWPWNLSHFESLQFARQLVYSLESMGKQVFPNFKTSYFYDNKVGQKYILEALNIPHVPTYVFYKKEDAKKWVSSTEFPKVFKLSGGAGAMNVKLCKDKKKAHKYIDIAFGKGFSQVNRFVWFQDKIKKFKLKPSKTTAMDLVKSYGRLFVPTQKEREMGREKGYVYFQEFIENNKFDIRVIVIGSKAFAIKRLCRDNDFRASGSGNIVYDKNQIDTRCVQLAFDTSDKLDVQCMGYDFVFDKQNNPLIVEMSYHFSVFVYDDCQGYWDKELKWNEGNINPQYMIIESLLQSK